MPSSSWVIKAYRESYHIVTIFVLLLIRLLRIATCYFLFPKGKGKIPQKGMP